MVEPNLRKHELLGLVYQFLGATSIGIGIYFAVWFAVRPLFYHNIAQAVDGAEWLFFPIFFGLGALLWSFGTIEIKEALPGHARAELSQVGRTTPNHARVQAGRKRK